MKKQSIFVIGIVVVVISCLSEGVLSIMEHEQWSNYVQTWETKWTSVDNKKTKDDITVCTGKLAHSGRNKERQRNHLVTSKR
jgi:hypothetical protein